MFELKKENIPGLILVCLGFLTMFPWSFRTRAILMGLYLMVVGICLMKR